MGGAVLLDDRSSDGQTFTDDELSALALAANPDVELAQDAMCLWDVIGSSDGSDNRRVLPEWYMPAPMAGARPRRRRWHRWVAVLVIASFVVIDALGLCITYGQLVVA